MGMFNVGIIYNIQKRYRYYTMQTLYKKNGSIDERIFLFFFILFMVDFVEFSEFFIIVILKHSLVRNNNILFLRTSRQSICHAFIIETLL